MEPLTYKYVTAQVIENGHIAVIKYNRPQSGNSLHPTLLSEMLSALQWADSQPEVRVIIQTGEGKFFSTGMELLETSSGPETSMSFAPGSEFYTLNKLLITSEKILIAAVNGPAVGYGVSSLALFDLVYSVPDAYFFTPFVKWGMAAEGGSSFSFPRLMGYQKAAALFLAGERISAQEADRLGLVSKILPSTGEKFLQDVVGIARGMVEMPWGAMKATKRLMRDPVRQDLLEANDRECAVLQNERLGSEEAREAMAQFRIEQERKRELRSRL
jgi:peroxisomal 3,2-trans-enoyl-CoA isomerase